MGPGALLFDPERKGAPKSGSVNLISQGKRCFKCCYTRSLHVGKCPGKN